MRAFGPVCPRCGGNHAYSPAECDRIGIRMTIRLPRLLWRVRVFDGTTAHHNICIAADAPDAAAIKAMELYPGAERCEVEPVPVEL